MQARDHQPARSAPVTSRATRSRTRSPSRSSTAGWASALAYQCGCAIGAGHRGHDRVHPAVRDPHQRRLAQPPGAGADGGEQHDGAPPQADAGALEVLDLLPHPGHGAGLVRPRPAPCCMSLHYRGEPRRQGPSDLESDRLPPLRSRLRGDPSARWTMRAIAVSRGRGPTGTDRPAGTGSGAGRAAGRGPCLVGQRVRRRRCSAAGSASSWSTASHWYRARTSPAGWRRSGTACPGSPSGDSVFGVVMTPYVGSDGAFAEYLVVGEQYGVTSGARRHGPRGGGCARPGRQRGADRPGRARAEGRPDPPRRRRNWWGGIDRRPVRGAGGGAGAGRPPGPARRPTSSTIWGPTQAVDYSDDLTAAVRAVAPDGVDAVLHLAGDPASWPACWRPAAASPRR